MAFYLKYRPQALEEIVGQRGIKEILSQAFSKNKLSHAYLFCGLKGTGKTSTARILAKMVNCQLSVLANSENRQQKTDNRTIPCNKCDSCISITSGTSLDLIEIDAASNRGIDDIRDLKEKIKLVPTSSNKKVYIIDEAHMLTAEAFNALLKTLEEPPDHALFILATTEPQKIPQTIMSRVQKLEFKQASTKDLFELLESIVKKEKIKIDPDAIRLIAKKGEGSFRDAVKLLEQLVSLGQETISTLDVQRQLSSGGFEDIIQLLNSIAQKDAKKGLETIGRQLEKGISTREYLLSVLDVLRAILLIKHQALEVVKEDLGSAKFTEAVELADKFSSGDLISSIGFFQQALEKLKISSHPTLPLEIAVVESCQGWISDVGYRMSNQTQSDNVLKIGTTLNPVHRTAEIEIQASPGVQNSSGNTVDPADMHKLLDKWVYILETVKPYNYSLEALLKQATVLSCEAGNVVFEVPYSFHQRILESPKNRSLLESVLSDVLEKEVRVSYVLGVKPMRIEEIANVELAADDEVIRVAAEIFNSEPVN